MESRFYPVVLHPAAEGGYVVDIPDLAIGTQGETVTECIDMARDAIGMWCICQQDQKKPIPSPATVSPAHGEDDIVTLVDIDVDAYRRANDRRTIRRNVSLPAWLDNAAREAGINVSGVLVSALCSELKLTDRY